MSEPLYMWLCNRCYISFSKNPDLVVKTLHSVMHKQKCEKCSVMTLCNACKISFLEDEKDG